MLVYIRLILVCRCGEAINYPKSLPLRDEHCAHRDCLVFYTAFGDTAISGFIPLF